jgi:hypothetical protein
MPGKDEMQKILRIIQKCPSLASDARKVAARSSETLMAKGTQKLITRALSLDVFSVAEREQLINAQVEIEDDTLSFTLRVRLTKQQEDILRTESDAAGLEMSEYVRQRVFGATKG